MINRSAPSGRSTFRARYRPTPSPNWPASTTARPSFTRTGSRRSACDTSTSSARDKIPDSPYSAVIPLFITALLSGKQPTIYGDGQQSRDFTFVENVVHGNLLAAKAEGVAGKTLNMANGRSTSLLQLLQLLNEFLGTKVQAEVRRSASG